MAYSMIYLTSGKLSCFGKIKMKNKLIVFGDAHFAKIWDDIDKLLGDKLPILNPNDELRKLVRIINRSDDALAVINTGDSIDYFFTDYFSNHITGNTHSNRDLFDRIAKRIEKPYCEIPGNHDYRRSPYNFNLYGLDHINLSDQNRRRFKGLIGHNQFRWLKEWSSLSVNRKKFDPLENFPGFKQPAEKDFGPFHCVFLDTGSDAFVKIKNLPRYARKMLRRKNIQELLLRRDWRSLISSDNEGLGKKELAFISAAIKKKHPEFYFFLHTPIINSRPHRIGKEYRLKKRGFLQSLVKQDLSSEVILNGGGAFLSRLADEHHRKKNFIIIASHIHNAKYFLINKETFTARQVDLDELNREKNNPRYIKHLTTLPLGALDFSPENRQTGYLTIGPEKFEEVILNGF